MKKIFIPLTVIILITIVSLNQSFAQVAINTDGTLPHPDAILDIKSTTKGLLFPRMTYAQRTAITTPPSGLMVYQTNTDPTSEFTPGFYVVSSGSWKKLEANVTPFQSTWRHTTGDETKQYSLTDRVGIGINDPNAYLHIRGSAYQHIKLDGQLPIINFAYGNPTDGYTNTGRIFATQNDLTIGGALGSNNKRIVFQLSGENKAYFEPDGNFKTKAEIRMTNDFVEKGFIQTNGNDLRLGTVSSNNAGNLVFRTNGEDAVMVNPAGDLVPLKNIQFLNGTTEKAFIQRNGDDLRLGTNSGNAAGNIIMRLNGADHYKFSNTGRLSLINSVNPTLYFSTDAATNKAYVQLQGEDIIIDAPGNKVNIGDDMTVNDATGYVGIGTTTPEYKLHVAGTGVIKTNAGKVLNNNNENMLPIAYATFNSSSERLSGTSNITCGWIIGGSIADCFVEVPGVDISNSVVLVTCRNANLKPSWTPTGTRIQINFYDDDGDPLGPVGFSVLIYKAN